MNITILVLLFVLFHFPVLAQPPAWQWAAHGINTSAALGSRVAADAAGNTCTAGIFNGSLQFGDSVHQARGKQDVYIAFYDSDGRLLWSHSLGDTLESVCTAITMDKTTSDVYVAGTFKHKVRIGDSIFKAIGANDMFLVKYSAAGKFLWGHTYGSPYKEQISGMAVNSHRRLVFGGFFANIIGFGKDTLTSYGSDDIFVAQCDSGGQILWAKNFGGRPAESCYTLALDDFDNIFLSGDFSASTSLEGQRIPSISIGLFGVDFYIAKCDSSGRIIWARAFGGVGPASGHSFEYLYPSICSADSVGNVIIGGNFSGGKLIFDATDHATSVSGAGGGQWMAKYDPSGEVLWAKRISEGGFLRAITCDGQNNIYLAGEYTGGCTFDQDTPYIPANAGVTYMFAAKYTPSGHLSWIRTAGDNSGAVAFDMAVIRQDEAVVTGQFYNGTSIQFGNTACYNTGTLGNGFVAKLKPVAASVPKAQAAEVRIYPNPTRGELHIEQAAAGTYTRYVLFNALGQRVMHGHLRDEQRQRIQLPQLAPGVYYLELGGAGAAVARKSVSIQP